MHNKEGNDADCIVTAIRDIYSGFKSRRAIATSGDTNELEEDDAQIEEQEQESGEDADELTDVLAAMEFSEENDDEDTAEGGDGQLRAYLLGDVWTDGWTAIDKMDIKAVRKHMQERRTRTRCLTKHTLRKVNEMCLSED